MNGKKISQSTGVALGLVVILLAVVGTAAIAWGKLSERMKDAEDDIIENKVTLKMSIDPIASDIGDIKISLVRIETLMGIETQLEERDN